MQETYHAPRSKYSLCCPIPGGTSSLAGGCPIPGQGVPNSWLGVPICGQGRYPSPGQGVSHSWPGVPHPWLEGTLIWGTPSLAGGTPCWGTSRKDMGPVEVLWDEDGVPSPHVNRETPVKTVPSRHTTRAVTRQPFSPKPTTRLPSDALATSTEEKGPYLMMQRGEWGPYPMMQWEGVLSHDAIWGSPFAMMHLKERSCPMTQWNQTSPPLGRQTQLKTLPSLLRGDICQKVCMLLNLPNKRFL